MLANNAGIRMVCVWLANSIARVCRARFRRKNYGERWEAVRRSVLGTRRIRRSATLRPAGHFCFRIRCWARTRSSHISRRERLFIQKYRTPERLIHFKSDVEEFSVALHL